MLADFGRILVLAPHIDDGEFGCGGCFLLAQLERSLWHGICRGNDARQTCHRL